MIFSKTSCAVVISRDYLTHSKTSVVAKCACDYGVVILCAQPSGRRFIVISAHLPTHEVSSSMYTDAWQQLTLCCRRLSKASRGSYTLEMFGWIDASLELGHLGVDKEIAGNNVSQPETLSTTMVCEDQVR